MLGLASLPVDDHLLAYWGFDEANANDVGLDRSKYGNTLTFQGAATPVPGKVGNARTFDGTAVYATSADSSLIVKASHATILVWATLNSVNTAGSMMRTIVACDGPSNTTSRQNTVFAVGVDQNGMITYRHDMGTAEPVVLKTASGMFPTGHFLFLSLVRTFDAQGNVLVTLRVNNKPMQWASATVNGVAQPDANAAMPPPVGGEDSTLRIGVSQKLADDFWDGLVDELSVHDIERSVDPYITGAYFKTALLTNITRMTDAHTVKGLGVADLQNGGRWWVYERDMNCYAIRETALGTFEAEVQLTTGGTQGNNAPLPGMVTQPRLAYDASTDTLVVAFIAAGRVFKLTAQISDAPGTLNMPYTNDTATVIKARDATDAMRSGGGGPSAVNNTLSQFDSYRAGITFYQDPTFGISIFGSAPYGYRLYRVIGGAEFPLVDVHASDACTDRGRTYYNVNIAQRTYGIAYRARPLTPGLTDVYPIDSNTLIDYEGAVQTDGNGNERVNDYGDGVTDLLAVLGGVSTPDPLRIGFSSTVPIKMTLTDSAQLQVCIGGGSVWTDTVTWSSSVPIKLAEMDTAQLQAGNGGGSYFSITGMGQTVQA